MSLLAEKAEVGRGLRAGDARWGTRDRGPWGPSRRGCGSQARDSQPARRPVPVTLGAVAQGKPPLGCSGSPSSKASRGLGLYSRLGREEPSRILHEEGTALGILTLTSQGQGMPPTPPAVYAAAPGLGGPVGGGPGRAPGKHGGPTAPPWPASQPSASQRLPTRALQPPRWHDHPTPGPRHLRLPVPGPGRRRLARRLRERSPGCPCGRWAVKGGDRRVSPG